MEAYRGMRGGDSDEDEDFNYDSEYKSKCTGLGALLGSIRSNDGAEGNSGSNHMNSRNYSAQHARSGGFGSTAGYGSYSRNEESEFGDDTESRTHDRYLQKVCDTGPGMPHIPRVMRMGQSYFCDICNLSLTSETAHNDHVNGMKHLKKARNAERAKVLREAGLDTPPAPKRKATAMSVATTPYVSLQELVKTVTDPVVGLSYVTGYLPATNPEDYEVSYQCSLCMVTALTSVMFTHVMGVRHRSRFAEMVLGHSGLDRVDLLDVCRQHEWKNGRDVDSVTTVFDDSKYPFLPGKGPRKDPEDRVDPPKSRFEQPHERESDEDKSRNHSMLMRLSLCTIRSEDDAAMAHQVITNLTRSLVKFKASKVDQRHSNDMTSCCESLLRSLNTLMSVPTQEVATDSTRASMGTSSTNAVAPSVPRTRPGPPPPASFADLRLRWQPVTPGQNQAQQSPIPSLPKPIHVRGESPSSTSAPPKRPALLPSPPQRLLPHPRPDHHRPEEGDRPARDTRLPLEVRLRNLVEHHDDPPPLSRSGPAPFPRFGVPPPPPGSFTPPRAGLGRGRGRGALQHSQPNPGTGPRTGFGRSRPLLASASAEIPSLISMPLMPRPTQPGQF